LLQEILFHRGDPASSPLQSTEKFFQNKFSFPPFLVFIPDVSLRYYREELRPWDFQKKKKSADRPVTAPFDHGQLGLSLTFPPRQFPVHSYVLYAIDERG
jgi:hypothetical protein